MYVFERVNIVLCKCCLYINMIWMYTSQERKWFIVWVHFYLQFHFVSVKFILYNIIPLCVWSAHLRLWAVFIDDTNYILHCRMIYGISFSVWWYSYLFYSREWSQSQIWKSNSHKSFDMQKVDKHVINQFDWGWLSLIFIERFLPLKS